MNRFTTNAGAVVSAIVCVGGATQAYADDARAVSGPLPGEVSARALGMVSTDADAPMFGIDVSRPFNRWMGLAAVAGVGSISEEAAATVELLGRFGIIGRRHSWTIGIGPGLVLSRALGRVTYAQSELAYEYRVAGGLSLIGAYAVGMALNESASHPCTQHAGGSDSIDFDCGLFYREQFHAGDLTARARLGLGFQF